MMRIIIFSVVFMFFLGLLIYRLLDIYRNEDKYINKKLELASERFVKGKKCFFLFKCYDHQVAVLFGLPIMTGVVGLLCYLSYHLRKWTLIPKGFIEINNNESAIMYIPLLFIGIPLTFRILLLIKTIKANLAATYSYDSRIGAWRSMIKLLLMIFILAFPIYALAFDNYGYYNNEKIVYNNFFSLKENELKYENIKNVDMYFHKNNKGEISSVHYVIYGDDFEIDILFIDEVNQTFIIHNYILLKNPDVIKHKIIHEDEIMYLNKYNHDRKEKLYFIFGLN